MAAWAWCIAPAHAAGRTVAVKVLAKHRSETDQRRFLQEARLASQIVHPNIVYISDFGVLSDSRPYLVMGTSRARRWVASCARPADIG